MAPYTNAVTHEQHKYHHPTTNNNNDQNALGGFEFGFGLLMMCSLALLSLFCFVVYVLPQRLER